MRQGEMKSGRLFSLNAWPVLQRELREGARRPALRRLRLLGALAAALMAAKFLAGTTNDPEEVVGPALLAYLHALIMGFMFLVVPGLTADCLSRERRDGTLVLLFLTPLTSRGIVAGKVLAQVLRAFTLWLAVLPVLIIPFLAGGVSMVNASGILSAEFSAILLCLGGGLLASSFAKQRASAFILAYLFAWGLLAIYSAPASLFSNLGYQRLDLQFGGLLALVTGDDDTALSWAFYWPAQPVAAFDWILSFATGPTLAAMVFLLLSQISSGRINRLWRDNPPSVRIAELERRYCTPIFYNWFRRAMNATLDRNPIAWLQQHSWKARLSTWGLCFTFLVAEIVSCYVSSQEDCVRFPLFVILLALYTFFGISGFLEEKRSGALELLLITPIPVTKIILGRAAGLWRQFLPAALLLALMSVLWPPIGGYANSPQELVESVCFLVSGFFTLPIFATYFALRTKNLLLAGALTWIVLLLVGIFAVGFRDGLLDELAIGDVLFAPVVVVSYGAFALLACFLLKHSLSRRIYSF